VERAALKFQAPVTEGREAGWATEKLRTGTVTEKSGVAVGKEVGVGGRMGGRLVG